MPVSRISVTSNVVGLQTASVGHVGQNSNAHVARRSGLQTDSVVVNETGLYKQKTFKNFYPLQSIKIIRTWRFHFFTFLFYKTIITFEP